MNINFDSTNKIFFQNSIIDLKKKFQMIGKLNNFPNIYFGKFFYNNEIFDSSKLNERKFFNILKKINFQIL